MMAAPCTAAVMAALASSLLARAVAEVDAPPAVELIYPADVES